MLRRIFTLISVGLVIGVNADQDKLDKIQKTLDNIMSKAGISFGGEFRSQYFTSKVTGDDVDITKRKVESNEYTSVDFDIKARPNEAISARVMFRMHQNWQNFFSDVANPISSRWISIDGNPLDMFRFSVGDYKEKYSPLTLWTPEIDMLYEPDIFARQRKVAMDELFLGDNYRVLQGVNFGFDAEIAPLFDEFHFGFSGARLMSAQTSPEANSNIPLTSHQADMDKYYIGTNLHVVFLKGINLAGSWIEIFDNKKSFDNSKLNVDTVAQKTAILSFRPGIDIAKTVGSPEFLDLKLDAEIAVSMDDSTTFDIDNDDTVKIHENVNGTALNIEGKVGFKFDEVFGIKLNASYIMNDPKYRNLMAQSPSFVGSRIMNVEADEYSSFYSTFDALYNQVFKFTPYKGVNGYMKAPYMKTSYTKSVFMQDSLNAVTMLDPSVQLVMPLGPATPNRAGFNADLTVSMVNNFIELKGLVTALNEKTAVTVTVEDEDIALPKTKFSKMGGGAKLDFNNISEAIKYPMQISGSFVASKASNDFEFNNWEITSNMTNLGVYYQFWKRMSLLGGFQVIDNKAKADTIEVAQNYKNWAVGLEWKVSDGASVIGSVGKVIADLDQKEVEVEDETQLIANDWPDGMGTAASGGDFEQMQVNLFLRVKF